MEDYLSITDNAIGLDDVGDRESIYERIRGLSSDSVAEFRRKIAASLPRPKAVSEKYRFIGNSELSGLPHPCASFRCRGERLRQIIFFSAAYADEICLFNPFNAMSRPRKINRSYAENLAFHVSELLAMRPLIDRGMVSFIDFDHYTYCPNCFRKGIGIATGVDPENGFYFKIANDVIRNTDVVYNFQSKEGYHFSIDTKSMFYGHPRGGYVARSRPAFIDEVKKGDHLNQGQIVQLGIGRTTATYASNDIIQISSAAEDYNFPNVFTSRPQISILRDYFGSKKVGNDIEINYPLIAQGRINDVLSFRDAEWHHLHDFRKFVDDAVRENKNVTDELQDETAKIQHIVGKLNRSMNKTVLKDAGILATNVVAALATSGVSSVMAAIVGILSGGHLATKILPDLIDKFSEPEDIRDSKVYYAWKIEQLTGH